MQLLAPKRLLRALNRNDDDDDDGDDESLIFRNFLHFLQQNSGTGTHLQTDYGHSTVSLRGK